MFLDLDESVTINPDTDEEEVNPHSLIQVAAVADGIAKSINDVIKQNERRIKKEEIKAHSSYTKRMFEEVLNI
jgi:hypothetical protein